MKMNNCYIPTCYFPSTVMLVDDSNDFLMNFSLQLDPNLAYRLYDSPYNALQAIKSTQGPDSLNQQCLSEYLEADSCPITSQTINLNLSSIHTEIYNPHRFSEISVLIVDYAMPGMNGLEFCKRIENSPIKKVLLTGKANEKVAVQAFNEGIIDRYIRKQELNITTLINETIHQLQQQYFHDMSDIVVNMLSFNSPNILQDPKFAIFFSDIYEQNNIVESYITETSGSYLLLTAEGEASCLIVKSQQDFDLYYEMALDNKAPTAVLEKLKSGQYIPYFWQADGYFQAEWNYWATHLYPAKKIEFNGTYYYALIKRPFSFDIQQEKILSYNEYLEQLDLIGYRVESVPNEK